MSLDAPALDFDTISLRFGEFSALQGVSFTIPSGQFAAFVGPSGCGKTTLLNLAAGLLVPSSGAISCYGQPLRSLNTHATYLFQQDALLPWKTVLENVAAGPIWTGRPPAEAKEEAKAWLDRVGLAGFADHYPAQLSGGMKKRAALAQNWILHRDLLLLDEPFAALDVHTRLHMHRELLRLWTLERKTAILVTHDLDEAVALADRVFVLSAAPGRIIADYEIPLPRPRERFDPASQALVQALWRDLAPQVEAHAR